MKRINNSNFESIKEIIEGTDFKYNRKSWHTLEKLKNYWQESAEKQFLKTSKVFNFSADNILTIVCADSYAANELYFKKEILLKRLNEKAQKADNILIEDIRFDYKKWKEHNE